MSKENHEECRLCMEYASYNNDRELERLRAENADMAQALRVFDQGPLSQLKPQSLGEEMELQRFQRTWNRIRRVPNV